MSLPPDPDTIRYPPENVKVILSVSEDSLDFTTGLDAPLDLYVEKFFLKKTLTTHNTDTKDPIRYGLFTHELSVANAAENGAPRLSLELTGADGGYFEEPATKKSVLKKDGFSGGVMDLYVQEVDEKTAKSLLLNVSGGKGFSPPNVADAKNGEDGGNGGNGGTVSILCGTSAGHALRMVENLLSDIADEKKTFPSSFRDSASDLVAFCRAKQLPNISASLLALENALKGTERQSFKSKLLKIVVALGTTDEGIRSAFTQTTIANGGYSGRGSNGATKDGSDGTRGTKGNEKVLSCTDTETLWNSQMCFLHPIQCRMLLDKAKLYFYVNGERNLAKFRLLVDRLLDRLQFLDTKPPSKEAELIKAYRASELRLCIPSGPVIEEPVAIKDLRAIKSEAEATLDLFNSGKDFYGFDTHWVPRRTYMAYKQIIEEELKHLKSAEEYYTAYLKASTDAAKRRDYINQSSQACQGGKEMRNGMIKEAKEDMQNAMFQIHNLTEPMKAEYEEIKNATQMLMVEIKNGFKVPFPHLVEALGQIFMVRNAPMVALQGVSLVEQGLSKIPDDSGTVVDKDYLIKQISNVTGDLDSVYEGYKVSKGKINLLDPGAAKLQLAAGDLTKLVNKYQEALPEELRKKLKDKLKSYITNVLKRNDAVIRYNANVALIIQCYTEIAALNQSAKNLADFERSTLATDSPMMTVAMKRIYIVRIQNLQSWLYRALRAYNFDALDSNNVLAKFFGTIDTSQYTYALVEQAHAALYGAYSNYLDEQTKARTTFNATKYQFNVSFHRAIKEGGTERKGLIFMINPPSKTNVDENLSGPNPFEGMADVRLTRVRFFLPGAKTTSGLLHVTMTHMGDDTLLSPNNHSIEFSHRTIAVDFKYDIKSGSYAVPGKDTRDGVIGNLGDREEYCLPGPFTSWRINFKDYNPGLDLSEVNDAYMEFEGVYRPFLA